MNRQQRRAAEAQMRKSGYKKNQYNVGASVNLGSGPVMFLPEVEAKKMEDLCARDKFNFMTHANDEDLATKFPHKDFGEMGFFIAIIKGNATGVGVQSPPDKSVEQTTANAREAMSHYKCRPYGNGEYLFTAGCTWDYAKAHYKEVFKTFDWRIIGFSTPSHCSVMAEDPN